MIRGRRPRRPDLAQARRPVFGASAGLVAALALSACVTPPPAPSVPPGSLQAVDFTAIPGWAEDDSTAALGAFRVNCRSLTAADPATPLGGAGIAAARGGRAGDWATSCRDAEALFPAGDPPAPAAARAFFETHFDAFRITGPASFTGYFDPEVPGSLAPSAAYPVPVQGRPLDLAMGPPPADPAQPRPIGRYRDGVLQPYWTRAEIMAGRLGAAARPVAWVQNAIDLLVLQIQGSGRLRLPDGSLRRLAFDGKNGRLYTPIGRVLVARGAIAPDQVSLQSIRAWLSAHPDQAAAVMAQNESYVFFRRIDAPEAASAGPPGAMGVSLTAERSAAIDRAHIPLGAPVFADTTDPLASGGSDAAWQHLLIAQDLGSAIGGPARADIFFGSGAQAEARAGRLHAGGALYVLLPKA